MIAHSGEKLTEYVHDHQRIAVEDRPRSMTNLRRRASGRQTITLWSMMTTPLSPAGSRSRLPKSNLAAGGVRLDLMNGEISSKPGIPSRTLNHNRMPARDLLEQPDISRGQRRALGPPPRLTV